MNTEYTITWFDSANNPIRGITQGRLVVSFTNASNPANHVTLNISGPGKTTFNAEIPWWIYAGVFANPFFSVSGTDGKYKISGLPPGTYEVEAWHEKLGTQTTKVTVAANKPAAANFSFAPPAK